MNNIKYDILTVSGATAGGKTSLAAHIAYAINGEVISADSRQVYKNMDIGTGKDIEDYIVNNFSVPHHLIDIIEAGKKYNVFEYQKDFLKAYNDLIGRGKFPVLCGGTGMYIESVLKGYKLVNVPVNDEIRSKLRKKSDKELIDILKSNKELHNRSDTSNRKRLVRAVEIALFYSEHPEFDHFFPKLKSLIIQVVFDRESRRKRISKRLYERLENGMVEEVKKLIDKGVEPDTLMYYGLEYKFITEYLLNKIKYNEMVSKLEIAIHQFSKRQMTWFRKMEKDGFKIHKIDGYIPLNEKVEKVLQLLIE